MREENFWCKKPRYSEVRVITRRVIASNVKTHVNSFINSNTHPRKVVDLNDNFGKNCRTKNRTSTVGQNWGYVHVLIALILS